MSLQTLKDQKGFTIVELLIVIVVIGILAAITIVAYNGIQNRAKSTAGQNLASQVAKKAESWNTVESTYPTQALLIANNGDGTANNSKESKLDNASAVKAYTAGSGTGGVDASATYDSGKAVVYNGTTTGGCVYYWDFAASTAGKAGIKVGNGTC